MKHMAALLLALCLLLYGCSPDNMEPQQIDNEYETYVLAFPCDVEDEQLLERTCAEINAILEQRLNIQIQFLTFPFDCYWKEMRKLLAGSRQVDVMLCQGDYTENWLCGNLLPLEELLEQYGGGLVQEVGVEPLRCCEVNGSVYGVPNIRDYAVTTDTYYLNEEIVARNGFDIEQIKTPEDLEELFFTVSSLEPNTVILSGFQFILSNQQHLNHQMPFASVFDEEQNKYVNYFATDEYRLLLEKVRRWYQNGYVGFYHEAGEIIEKHGSVLAISRCGKPGGEDEMSRIYGVPYREVCFGTNVIPQGAYTSITYTITKNTISPGESMKLLNELYQNAQLNELLSHLMLEWMVPNLFLTEVEDG